MAEYAGKNKITLGLINEAGDEYGTVEWTIGKGKLATTDSEIIYPDPDTGRWLIDAGAGDDLIDASLTDRPTELLGGTGNDTIYGGTFGSSGYYPYFGGIGEDINGDYIDGGAGRDWIDAGTGNDVVVYDAYDQRVEGDGGFDTLDASGAPSVRGRGVSIDLGSTRDIFSGFEGIIGSAYADTLKGNEASNFIDGGAGADTIRLGYGEDYAIYDANDTLVDGGYDRDYLYGGNFAGPEGITLNLETSTTWLNFERVFGSQFADTLTGDSQDNSLEGADGDDWLSGGAGHDYLSGGSGNDTIEGGDGNDDLSGSEGIDHLDGGAGADFLSAGSDDDTAYGGAGNDQIYGEDGADHLDGGADNDNLHGDNGDDVLDGGEGADYVRGGNGNDTVVYDADDVVFGDAGIDTLDASTATLGVTINLNNSSYWDFENIIGSDEVDDLTGRELVPNVLTGGGGADYLSGSAGPNLGEDNDTFVYNSATDSYVRDDSDPADGFDHVFATLSDYFNFDVEIAVVQSAPTLVLEEVGETGSALLTQLNVAFQTIDDDTTNVEAATVLFSGGGQFLVVDRNADQVISTDDQVIELIGINPFSLNLISGDIQLIASIV